MPFASDHIIKLFVLSLLQSVQSHWSRVQMCQ